MTSILPLALILLTVSTDLQFPRVSLGLIHGAVRSATVVLSQRTWVRVSRIYSRLCWCRFPDTIRPWCQGRYMFQKHCIRCMASYLRLRRLRMTSVKLLCCPLDDSNMVIVIHEMRPTEYLLYSVRSVSKAHFSVLILIVSDFSISKISVFFRKQPSLVSSSE